MRAAPGRPGPTHPRSGRTPYGWVGARLAAQARSVCRTDDPGAGLAVKPFREATALPAALG